MSNKIIKINQNILQRNINKKIVFFNPKNNKIYSFNKIGQDFINLIDGKNTENKLINLLLLKYEYNEEKTKEQIYMFIQQLKKLNIIL